MPDEYKVILESKPAGTDWFPHSVTLMKNMPVLGWWPVHGMVFSTKFFAKRYYKKVKSNPAAYDEDIIEIEEEIVYAE